MGQFEKEGIYCRHMFYLHIWNAGDGSGEAFCIQPFPESRRAGVYGVKGV